jgi:hypothetical protein
MDNQDNEQLINSYDENICKNLVLLKHRMIKYE